MARSDGERDLHDGHRPAAHHLRVLETLWAHFCGTLMFSLLADPETLDAELPGLLGGLKLMLRALPTPPTPPYGDVEAK